MKRLVLVRHGESEWNRERRIQGQAGTGLTATGREQARHAAQWLSEAHDGAVLVASDLQRCVETADPIAAALDAEVRQIPDLRERHFGDWTGRLVEEVEEEDGDRFERWRSGEDVLQEVGGESSPDLAARVVGALEGVLDDIPDGGTAVVVTHGGPVWHGTRRFLDLPDACLGPVANASITELVADPTWGRRLFLWNQVAHLPHGLRTWLRSADGDPDD